jgi:hypothetical protein
MHGEEAEISSTGARTTKRAATSGKNKSRGRCLKVYARFTPGLTYAGLEDTSDRPSPGETIVVRTLPGGADSVCSGRGEPRRSA